MSNLKSIVAAIDFSDEARQVVDRAAIVSQEHHAHLKLVHVVSRSSLNDLRKVLRVPADVEDKLVEDARHRLNEVAATAGKTTPEAASTYIKTGQVLEEILSEAETADVLVLGAHGTNPLRDLILGTTAERLLGKCKRPVLVVKRPPRGAYEHVIVPVDFSPYSAPALRVARKIAPHARMTIVHAFRVPFEGRLSIAGASHETIQRYCEEEREEAVKNIRTMIQDIPGDRPVSCVVERGDASRVILAKAEELSADLIVIGKHGHSMVEELLLGSSTRHVLSGSQCDVLVVHERE